MKLAAVILDWAGTTVDFGSLAPVRTLMKVFEQFGIDMTEEETRRDMGLPKRDHIAAILNRKRQASQQEIDRIYQAFIPAQTDCLPAFRP